MTKPATATHEPNARTKRQYLCNDCGVDVIAAGEWYMAHPKVWEGELGSGWTDNLCIGCLEQRLGRRVTLFEDIGPASDRPSEWKHISDRLLDRFGHKSKPRKRKRNSSTPAVRAHLTGRKRGRKSP
jgi:hypothetical protein